MNEQQYYAGEYSDAEIDVLADLGDFYLEESGFNYMPTTKDMDETVRQCYIFVINDMLRGSGMGQ